MPEAGRPVLMAGFAEPADLAAALRALRQREVGGLQAFGPYRSAEIEALLDGSESRLPLIAGASGLLAAAAAFAIQQAIVLAYPLSVGGFALWRFWPFVPITFITGVLVTAVVAFGGFCLKEGLPFLHGVPAEESCLQRVADGEWVLRVEQLPGAAAIDDLLADHAVRWRQEVSA